MFVYQKITYFYMIKYSAGGNNQIILCKFARYIMI